MLISGAIELYLLSQWMLNMKRHTRKSSALYKSRGGKKCPRLISQSSETKWNNEGEVPIVCRLEYTSQLMSLVDGLRITSSNWHRRKLSVQRSRKLCELRDTAQQLRILMYGRCDRGGGGGRGAGRYTRRNFECGETQMCDAERDIYTGRRRRRRRRRAERR